MATSQTCQALAQLMCDSTLSVLWHHYRDHLQQGRSGTHLECRVGSGMATYHRYDHRVRHHLINYGVKMVAAKHDGHTAANWLSTREIRSRPYFDGEVSVLNLLAHTCVHEFAHLLQQHDGKRFHGSVHNRHFYSLLDQLNGSGLAQSVRWYLTQQAEQRQLTLDARPLELPSPRQQAHQWQPGAPVRFGEGANTRQGRIVRVNRRTCTVQGTGTSRGLRFRVPFQLLKPE